MPDLHTGTGGTTHAMAGQTLVMPLQTACQAVWLLTHAAFESEVLGQIAQ